MVRSQMLFFEAERVLMFAAPRSLKRTRLLRGLIAGKARCQAAGAKLVHKGGTGPIGGCREEERIQLHYKELERENKRTCDSSLRCDETGTLTFRRGP